MLNHLWKLSHIFGVRCTEQPTTQSSIISLEQTYRRPLQKP